MGDQPRMLRPNHYAATNTRIYQPKEAKKLSACKQGYDRHWRRFRLAYLDDNPICVRCEAGGRIVPATVVDHVVPMSQGGAHMVESNSQALCKRCHDLKTMREDGGLGRMRRMGVKR